MSSEDLGREIRDAVARLAWPASRFRVLHDGEASEVWRSVESRFVVEPRSGWWWSWFRPEPVSARYIGEASYGYRYITEVAPPNPDPLWLIAGDCLDRSFAACEGSIEDIRDVIGECYGFEYYIAPKDLSWLLCENHHDVLIAVGDAIRARLLDMSSRHPEAFSLLRAPGN
jgi:hypothetical protein